MNKKSMKHQFGPFTVYNCIHGLFGLLLAFCATFALSACSSDDDDNDGGSSSTSLSSAIVGSWSTVMDDINDDGTQDGIIFNADGTGIYVEHYDRSSGADVDRFTYTVDEANRRIITNYSFDTEILTNVVIKDNRLTYTSNDYPFTLVRKDFSYTVQSDDGADEDDSYVTPPAGGEDDDDEPSATYGPSDYIEGTVVANVAAIGPGVYYSSFATNADGKTDEIVYHYYPYSGKYYIYGGRYCSDPSSNGGKGLRFEAESGYNSVSVYHQAYFERDAYDNLIKYDWYIYLRFTLPYPSDLV